MNRREQILAKVFKWLNDYAFLEALLSDREEYKLDKLAASLKPLGPIRYAEEARMIIGLKPDAPVGL